MVAVVDRNGDEAGRVAEAICAAGGRAKSFQCDVAESAQVGDVASAVERDLGFVGVIANVAGIGDTAGAKASRTNAGIR